MIADLETAEVSVARADVAVIGAGAVGLPLAAVLARAGLDVVLVESGGTRFEQAAQRLNAAEIAGRTHVGVHEGRMRLLGGTTTVWGGQLAQFGEIDFMPRSWVAESGWPILFADLHPYYRQAAHLLGLDMEQPRDEQVWAALKMRKPDLGPDFDVILTRWLKETNFARLFATDIRSNPKLRVLLHATACGFELAPNGREITAAQIRSPGGRTTTVTAKTFVVATGSIEASRLMLAAALENSALPWNGNRWVGAAFQDHLDLRAARVAPTDQAKFSAYFDNIFVLGRKYQPKIRLRDSTQRNRRSLNIAASFIFDSSLGEHLENFKLFLRALRRGSMPPNLLKMPRHLSALAGVFGPLAKRYLRDHRVFNLADRGIYLNLHCEQQPLAESAVRINPRVRDEVGMPVTILDWRVHGREIDTAAGFCALLGERMSALGLARLDILPALAARDPGILDACTDSNHQCGGLRMARDPANGVVDSDLRVFGTDNLYVAGTSVFPTSSFANPTFTAIALAMRLAERLADHRVQGRFSHGVR
jgi:choline dehydrogenase-like flavoprotein